MKACPVVFVVLVLLLPGCLSRETQDKLDGFERDKQAATDRRLSVQAELDKLAQDMAAATAPEDVARLEALRTEAQARLDLAKVQEALAISTLTTAKAGADEERLRSGVQIAEWATEGIGGILSVFFPALGPVFGVIGAVLSGIQRRKEEKPQA